MERRTMTVGAAQTQTRSEANDAKPCLPEFLITLIGAGGGSYDFTMPVERLSGREMTVRALPEEMVERGDHCPDDARAEIIDPEQMRSILRDIPASMLAQTESSEARPLVMHCIRDEDPSPVLIAPDTQVRFPDHITDDRRLTISFTMPQWSSQNRHPCIPARMV